MQTIINQITTHSEDRMHPFDSPTLQRQGGGTRLQTLYGLLASLLVLLTVGTSTGWAQAPTLATAATYDIICAGNTADFDLTPDTPDEINYLVNAPGYAGQNGNQFYDITNNFGDETVYHLPGGDIAAEVGAFPFTFFGTTHDLSAEGIYIGSNGFLRFENYDPNDNIEANEFGINAQAIPNPAGPNDAIYFLNIDLFPQAGAGEFITWDYDGGIDAIVVTFNNVSQFNVNNPGVYPYQNVTVQVVLYSDNTATPGRIQVNLEEWPNPGYIPNAHTIGVENNCGDLFDPNDATAAGAPGAHNQGNWANADNGLAAPDNGVEQTTWEFDPNFLGVADYFARLVSPGVNGIRETFDINAIGGDDAFASPISALNAVTLTSDPLNTPGTYEFYAVVSYENCYLAQTALPYSEVQVDPQPTVQTINTVPPGTTNFCEGPTYQFNVAQTVANSTFTWSLAPLVNGVDYTIALSGTGDGTADITFLTTGAAGAQTGAPQNIDVTETGPAPENCAITSNLGIVVYTTPAGVINTTSPAYCAANTGTVPYVDFASFSGAPANTYAWTLTNTGTTGATLGATGGTALPDLTLGVYSQPSLPHVVTLNLTATNGPAGLCSFTTSTTFTVNPSPTAKTFTQLPLTNCTNVATTYTLGGTLAGNTYGYSFTGAGNFSGPDVLYISNTPVLGKSTIQITWSGAGASSVSAIETTPQGCARTHTTNFTVSATPAPTILGSNVPCQFLPSAAGPPAFQTNPTPREYTYTLAVGPLTDGYRWTVVGGNIVAVNGVACACANPTPGAATFTVSGSAPSITVQWTTVGAGSVQVHQQGVAPNSCVGTTTYPVVVSASPTAAAFSVAGPGVLGANPPCQNQATAPAAYTVTGAGQHNIQINGGVINASTYTISSPGPASGDVVSGAGPGTFGSVVWSALSGTIIHDYATVLGGCTSRETYSVTIQPLPTATISGLADVCGNSTGNYTLTGLSAGITSYQWGWTDAAGTFPFVGVSGGAIATPGPGPAVTSTNITFNNIAGTYYLGIRVVGPVPSGCAEEYVLAITITPQPATPILAGFAPVFICDSVTVPYTVTGTLGNDIRLTVVGGVFTAPSVGTSIAFAANGAAQPFSVQWINSANGGTGFVTAIQYTTGVPSCTSATATSPTITIVRQPNTTVAGPSPVCGNTTTNYVASNPQFVNSYEWAWATNAAGAGFGAGPVGGVIVTPGPGPGNTNTDVNWANVPGTYFLAVRVINTTGGANCTRIFTRTIVLNAQPATPVIVNNRLLNICDSTNSAVADYEVTAAGNPTDTLVVTVTGGTFPWSGIVPGNPPNSPVVRVPIGAGIVAGDLPVFWDFGGLGGVGTISAYIVTATVPQCSSLVGTMAPSQIVDPLPAFPEVLITPDPPGYCADNVPVNFDLDNVGDYGAGPYTVVWTWPSPAGGTTPGGFAGAPNDPVANNFTNEQYIVNNWTATPTVGFTTTFNIEITDDLTGCVRDNDYTVVVQPRPAPVVSGPVAACQEPTDPNGAAAGTTFINPRYTYSTPLVAGNFYNWSITDGYIVAYSTNNGVNWIQTVATSTMPGGLPIQNASQVQVVFFGVTPAAVKVAEITALTSPPGCQTTTPDFAVALDPLTPYTLSDVGPPDVCFNDPFFVEQNGSDVGATYQLMIRRVGGGPNFVAEGVPQAGTGGVLNWTVPTGLGTNADQPGNYRFRAVQTSAMGCISWTPFIQITLNPNPDTIPQAPLTDTICDTTPGIPFTVGPTVQALTFYDLEREGPVGVWTSYDSFISIAPPATITLTDASNPPGAAAPAGIDYNYRVVAVDLFTLCSTILDTSVIRVVDPCVPIIGAVNTPPGYNDDEVCIYGGFEEHLRTYKLATTPCFNNTPGIILNWYTQTPPGSLVTGAVREQGGDTAVVEWYTTGGTQYGWIIAEITLPAAFGGCIAYDTMQVRVYPLPVPVIGTGPDEVCQNQQNVIYTATLEAGDTYMWEVVGGLIDLPGGATGVGTTNSPSTFTGVNNNQIRIDWLDAANPSATITLTQTSTVGCLNRTTRTIVVNPTPTPSINGPAAPCGLDVVTYTTQNNAPTNSYAWSIQSGPGTIQSGATTNTIQFLTGAAATTTVIRVTETILATGCSKFNNFTINPVLKPTPAISRVTPLPGNVGNACLNTPMTYSIPTVAGNSRLWTIVGGTITSATNANPVSVTWNVVGNQSLTATEWVNASQCTTAVTQQVVVEPIPSPSITGPVLVCGSTSSNYSTPLVAGHTYVWSLTTPAHGNFVGSTTSNSSTILWNNPTPGNTFAAQVNVVETATLAGCSNSALLGVVVHRQPTVPVITRTSPAGNANQACTSDNITYSVTNNAGSTFLWNVTGGNIQSGQATSSIVVEWTAAGNGTVSLTETTTANTACFATGTLNVTVEEKPTPTVTGPTVVCGNAISTYSTPAVGGTTYLWTITAGTGTITSSATTNSINVTWGNPTPGNTFSSTVTVVQTTGTGNCTGTANAVVTIHRQPTVPVITRTSPAGNANQACTSDNITYSVTNNAGSTFLWNVTGGNIQSGQGTSSAVIEWTVAGNNTVTLTETTTANTACTAMATLNVAVEDKPTPTVTGPAVVCGNATSNYSTPAVAGDTYAWSIGNAAHGTITSSTTTNAITVMWNNPTPGSTFTALVTVNQATASGNCTGTANITVTVHRQPTVPVITRTSPAGNANQACTSDNITYSVTNNAGSTYLWNVTGGNIQSGQGTSSAVIEWTVAGNNTVTLTETTTANTACTAMATLNVAVENKPTPTVTGPAVVCGNATSNYSTPAVAGDTYAWSIGNAAHGTITSSTTTNAITVMWNNPTPGSTFTALVTVNQATASGNCTGTANITVTVHRQPTVPVITRTSPAGNANQACTSDNITYSVTNNAGSTYLWNVTGGNIQSGQGTSSAVIEWTVAGNNTVTVTETTAGNTACTAMGTLNVAVENKPTPTVTGPAVVCGNATSNYSTPAVAGDTYAWSIGNAAHGTITSSTTTNAITVMWNNPTPGNTFTALLTVNQATASGNCTGTANITVTVHRQPTVPVITRTSPAGNANQACTNDNITYSVTNNAGSTYLWNVTGGNIVSGQSTSSVVILWTVAGNNTVTLTETTTGNTACTAMATLNVAVEADPVPTVTGPAVVCGNQTATYSTPAVVGNTYAWTIGNPAHGTITSSTTTNSITILWNNPAVNSTFTALVTVNQATASGNCTGSANITVIVHRQPTPPTITRVSPAGNAAQACTSDNITYSVVNNLGSTFVWNTMGGNIQSGQGTNSIVVEWTVPGNGSVTVTETTAGNTACVATTVLNVAVENKPTPTVTGPAVVCGNATSNYSTPAVAGDTYLWTLANPAHGTITSSTTTNAITVLWNNPTAGSTFAASITVVQTTPSGNCSGTANIGVTVHRQPTTSTFTRVTPGGLLNEACTDQTIQYSIPNNAGSSYNWSVVGANIISGQGTNAITVQWNVAGTHNLTVVETTTANTACSATSVLAVTVEATPTPAITGPSIACGNTTSTFSTPNVPGNSYAWTLNNPAFGTYTSATNTNSANILWNNPALGATFAAIVTVTETTPTGNCVTATTRNVTIYRQPTVQTIARTSPAGNANQACLGDNITYQVAANTPSSTYLWNVVGGNIMSGQATPTLVVEWTTVGNGSVSVTETTAANTACFATSTLNVTVEAKPNPTISGPAVVCGNVTTNYSTPPVAGNTYLWSITNPAHGTITSSTTTNAITVVWNNPAPNTTFAAVLNVTESTATGNCVTSTSLNVIVHRQPTTPTITRLSPAGNPNQACQGDNITYTSVPNNAPGSTYQWTVTGGNIQGTSTTNTVVVEWTVAGNGSLTLVETTAGNAACFATATLQVGVEAKPNPSISGATVVCGNSVQNYSTPAVAGDTYVWTIANPAHGTITSSATTNAIQITWNNPAAGTTFPAQVTVNQTSPSGNCTGMATVTVTVHRQPVANPIVRTSPAGNANQACTGDNITYAVTTSNAGSTWNWTVTGGNLLSGQATPSIVVEWTTVGNQQVTVTESTTALAMCTFTNTLNVAVEAEPVPVISGPTVVCINTIHTHSTPFVAGNTYSWAITPAIGAPVPVFAPINGWNTSNEITLQWIQTGLHTLTVTQTSTSGNCVGTASIQVRVNPIPTPAITSTTGYGTPTTARPGVVCAGSTHTYSVTPTPGNVFFWTVTGGSIVSGQNTPNLIVTWGSAGVGTIGITETIPGSDCSGTDLDDIDKRPVPTPLVSGNVNPCANSTVIYTTPFVTGNTYTWSVTGPAGTTSFVVPGNPNQLSVTWGSLVFPSTAPGSVTVTESVAAVLPAGTCIASNTLNLTVRPNPPAVTITASQNPVCASDLNDVPPTINNVTYSTTPVAGVTYTWSITSAGTIVSGQGSSSIVARWTNTTTVPTTGTVTLVLTTPFGCTSTGSFVATINPLPNPVIAGPTSVCQNTIHNYSSAGIPGNSYTWALSGGNIIRSGQGTPNITVEWTLPGTHTLTLTETTIATGCTASNTISVTVNPIPTLQITASGPTTFCQGGDVTLTAPLGFANYIWNTGQSGRSIVVRTTGAYWVLVTDENGCSNTSDTIQVNVFPTTLPIITTTGPTTFCEGGSITLSAPSGFSAYLWSTGATTQSIVVTESGTYTVTVADNNGCTGTSTEVDVFVNPGPTPVLTVIGSTTICGGDSVEVRAPAGYPSYTWISTSGTDYGTGRTIFIKVSDTVYVTVTDVNGCPGTSDIVRVVLSTVTPPTVTASGPTAFCQGGSVTLTAPAGFDNYIWSNGSTESSVTVTESGTYTVTVTDNSLCAATSNTTTVEVFPTPAKPTIERNQDILTAMGPASTYQWYRDGTEMPGATSVTLNPTIAGIYRVEITDTNNCSNISDPFDYITTGVDDVTAGYVAEMRVYPNPTNGQFTIETEISQAGSVSIEIVNMLGESVLTLNEFTDGGKFRTSSHLGDLANGVYSIVLTSGNERWTVRLVRQ